MKEGSRERVKEGRSEGGKGNSKFTLDISTVVDAQHIHSLTPSPASQMFKFVVRAFCLLYIAVAILIRTLKWG